MPVNISTYEVDNSLPIEIRYQAAADELQRKWDRLLMTKDDMPVTVDPQTARVETADKLNEELYTEAEEAAALAYINSPQGAADRRRIALGVENYAIKHRNDPEFSLETLDGRIRAANDMFNDPDSYQFIASGNSFDQFAETLTFDEYLGKQIAMKTADVSTLETIFKQTTEDFTGTIAGGMLGAKVGSLFGPVGAAVGSISGATAGYYGIQPLKTMTTHFSPNSVAKEFMEKYHRIQDTSETKGQAFEDVKKLVDETFIPENRESWHDIAIAILQGHRDYLDMGEITGLGLTSIARGGGKLFNKAWTRFSAKRQAAEAVREGEIVTNKALSVTKSTDEVNAGADPDIIDLQFQGMDDGVARWSAEGYKRIGSGNVIDYKKYIDSINKRNYVTPSNNYNDFDLSIDGTPVHFVGGGSDGRQIMSYERALQKSNKMNKSFEDSGQYSYLYKTGVNTYAREGIKTRSTIDNYRIEHLIQSTRILDKKYIDKISEWLIDTYDIAPKESELNTIYNFIQQIDRAIATRVIRGKMSVNKARQSVIDSLDKDNLEVITNIGEGSFSTHDKAFAKELIKRFSSIPDDVKFMSPSIYTIPNNVKIAKKADDVKQLKKQRYAGYENEDGSITIFDEKSIRKAGKVNYKIKGDKLVTEETRYKKSPQIAYPYKMGNGYVVIIHNPIDKRFKIRYDDLDIDVNQIEVDNGKL